MEQMIQAMKTASDAVASRQAGAGFGGCMVALVKDDAIAPFISHVSRAYQSDSGIKPEVFVVQASAGADPLNVQAD